jgi:hypothetical protein
MAAKTSKSSVKGAKQQRVLARRVKSSDGDTNFKLPLLERHRIQSQALGQRYFSSTTVLYFTSFSVGPPLEVIRLERSFTFEAG